MLWNGLFYLNPHCAGGCAGGDWAPFVPLVVVSSVCNGILVLWGSNNWVGDAFQFFCHRVFKKVAGSLFVGGNVS